MQPPKFLLLLSLLVFATVSVAVEKPGATDVEAFVAQLKSHYQDTLPIQAFSLKYHFLNRRYRDLNYWDYQFPNLYMSQRLVEMDLQKRHFYDNDILYFSGGRLFDRVQFQNHEESLFYEKSATSLGREYRRRGMDSFDRFKRHIVLNVDFLAVRPLLEETNLGNINLFHDAESGAITLAHSNADEDVVDYQFKLNPLRLVSINHRALNGVFFYDDYQTTRGFTYARSVVQYYDGATEPTYIKFNDEFNIIDQVDPAKLQLPPGYGPEFKRGDGILASELIGKDLYLVTDSSAVINSLLKVNDDEIRVFGATASASVAENTLNLIREQFPKKTIASVYVTHPHGRQIAGLKVFAEQGIEILADEYTISAIKAYPLFSDDIAQFRFSEIEHEQIVEGAQFFVLENMHSKRQGFVYFEDSGIIFQSNFLHIPRDNTIAEVVPSYTRAFIDFIRRQQLKFNRIVGNHSNNNISVEVVNKTYQAMRPHNLATLRE